MPKTQVESQRGWLQGILHICELEIAAHSMENLVPHLLYKVPGFTRISFPCCTLALLSLDSEELGVTPCLTNEGCKPSYPDPATSRRKCLHVRVIENQYGGNQCGLLYAVEFDSKPEEENVG